MSIGVTRLAGPPETSQEFGPGRVQVAEVVETELVDDAQADPGPSVSAMAMAG
jgi:hypothetical protein